jgi:hypothetical protein
VIRDAGLSAFAVFFMQAPSFLAHQRDMQRASGRNNANSSAIPVLGEYEGQSNFRVYFS